MPVMTSLPPYGRRTVPAMTPIVVYGRRWCAISQMVRRYLDRMGIPYDYVDLDTDPRTEAQLSWMTGGRVHTPVVSVGGRLLVQPSIGELQWALRQAA